MKTFLIASVLLLGFALDCSAQSIADAARKERERQKQIHSRIPIITGTTAAIAAGSATTEASPTAAPETAAKPTGPTDDKGRGEKYWRGAFQKARDDIKHADDKLSILESKVKDLNTQLLNRDDIYNKENRLGPQITDTQKQLDDTRKEAEAARQKIPDLEEELRKSGGPAGWAR